MIKNWDKGEVSYSLIAFFDILCPQEVNWIYN